MSFKKEILSSYKTLSVSQTTKFIDFKKNLKHVSDQITELEADNSKLRGELKTLKGKIVILESNTSSVQPHEMISLILHETFELEFCSTNLIVYGIVESISISISVRVSHDKSKIIDIFGPISNSFLSSFKVIRLGKTSPEYLQPLKIMKNNKETAFACLLNIVWPSALVNLFLMAFV